MKTDADARLKAFRRERGNILVEFAIGAGILVLVFSGTFHFGYTFYQYNLLKSAVNAGARYAALRTYDSATATPSAAFLMAVQNVVVHGDPSGGSAVAAPGLMNGHVRLAVTFANGVPSTVKVSLNGYPISGVFGEFMLTSKPAVTYAFQGIFAPY